MSWCQLSATTVAQRPPDPGRGDRLTGHLEEQRRAEQPCCHSGQGEGYFERQILPLEYVLVVILGITNAIGDDQFDQLRISS